MSQTSETFTHPSLRRRDGSVDSAMEEYSRSVGERLRTVREERLYTLREVERASNAEFKSTVVAAYERGERMMSVQRLDRLAKFYDVPITHLLPRNHRQAPEPLRPTLTIRLDRLNELEGEPFDRFRLLVDRIQEQRGEYLDELTLREDDLRTVAALFDVPAAEMADRLVLLDLLT